MLGPIWFLLHYVRLATSLPIVRYKNLHDQHFFFIAAGDTMYVQVNHFIFNNKNDLYWKIEYVVN